MLSDATPDFLAGLEAALGRGILRAPEPRDLEEPRGRFRGRAAAVALPRSTGEVAGIVRACAEARVGIVPRAGGTGLVGGQVMVAGPLPLILSVERLDRIRAVLPGEEAIIAEAGVTLLAVQEAAAEVGRLFPLSLAAEGTARVGGALATNAGGVQVLRYGNARDLCLGIEAVLADGSVMSGLKTLRKDNTGYDLRHLLIGSEGTLGIITAASLRLFPRPRERATAWIAVASPEAALALLGALRERIGEAVSAFEIMHRTGLEFLAAHLPQFRAPIVAGEWFLLLELAAGPASGVAEALEEELGKALSAGHVTDAVFAASEAQRAAIWAVREAIPEANRLRGAVASHDVSLPLSRIPGFVAEAGRRLGALEASLRVNCFGHLGDGNLHYNVFPGEGRRREEYEGVREAITECVHGLVHELGGSVSAEHGIGRLRIRDLERFGDPGKLAAMRAIKRALDPLGILNPGAVMA
ncbi:MAG TPA: FAD-binding oxidoreductase [Paracoccaceae bacterium]|nr:FAD-binding oxidoreductase [Paracoccaceae bacterium]